MLKVNFVLPNTTRGWVIEKMASKTADALHGYCEVKLTEDQDPNADVNHWAHYLDLWRWHGSDASVHGKSKASFWVTHIDDPFKLQIVRELCAAGKSAICLSSDLAAALDAANVRAEFISWALPGSDGGRIPPRIVVGLATRLYKDGRKNEWMLVKLCSEFGPDHLEFRIWGADWESTVSQMRSLGVQVRYDAEEDYDAILTGLAECDYYLYCGMDEGSLGTIDAIKAGTPTIVTDQGFHRDLAPAIDHLFSNYAELRAIIAALVEKRIRRLAAIDATSWESYARRHIAIWDHLVTKGICPPRPADLAKPPHKVGGSLRMAWHNKSIRRYFRVFRLRDWMLKHLGGNG